MPATLALRAILVAVSAAEPAAYDGSATGPTGAAPGLRIEGCPAERASDIAAAWRLELQRKTFTDSAAGPIWVSFECHAAKIEIGVSTADGARSLNRELDVSSVPVTAQGRLVAIAAAELSTPLRRGEPEAEGANRSAASGAAEAGPGPRVAAVSAAAPLAAAAPTSTGTLAVFADARRFVRGEAEWLAGAGVGLGKRWKSGWALGTDAVLDTGSHALTLGRATTMLVSARPSIARSFGDGRARLALAAGARLTAVRLAGEPNQTGVDGASLWGFEVGPAVTVSGALRVARATSLSLLLEGGRAVGRTVGRQAGAAAITIEGAWVGAQLGVELSR